MRTAELAADIERTHNQPPPLDLARDLDPALLTDYLDEQYASHREAATMADRP
jgi:hypothetical protein